MPSGAKTKTGLGARSVGSTKKKSTSGARAQAQGTLPAVEQVEKTEVDVKNLPDETVIVDETSQSRLRATEGDGGGSEETPNVFMNPEQNDG